MLGRAAELLGEHDRIVEAAHPAAGDEAVEHDAAGLAGDLVPALHLVVDLEFVEAIELDAVRHDREIEQAAAHRPRAVIPFGGGAVGVAPGVGGIIPGAGVDQRPVQEIVAGVVGIFHGVEDIGGAELADSQHQAVGRLLAGELVDVGVDFFGGGAEVDGLADEIARHPQVGIVLAELIGLCARKAREPERVAQSESLVDLRVDPDFGSLPGRHPDIERRIPGLAA